MSRTSNDGGEDGARSVISGKSGFAHSGSVVDDKSGGVFVTHLRRVLASSLVKTTIGKFVMPMMLSGTAFIVSSALRSCRGSRILRHCQPSTPMRVSFNSLTLSLSLSLFFALSLLLSHSLLLSLSCSHTFFCSLSFSRSLLFLLTLSHTFLSLTHFLAHSLTLPLMPSHFLSHL